MSRSIRIASLLVLSWLLALPAAADGLQVMKGWVSMPIADEPAPVYFMIRNTGNEPRKLVGASSPGFERVEIHRGAIVDGQHGSERIDSFELPSVGDVVFAERGLFLILVGEHEFVEDEKLEIELEFADGEKLRFEALVRDA